MNKCSLSWVDDMWEASLNSSRYNLRDAFVDSVTTGDGSVIMHELGLGTFGTKAMIVQLISRSILPELKKSAIASHTSLPTMLHALLKKREENPSGPGALLLSIENMDLLISS